MKKGLTALLGILGIAGILYSGWLLYGSISGNIEKISLEKNVKKLSDEKIQKEVELKEITEKDKKLKKSDIYFLIVVIILAIGIHFFVLN